MQIRPGSAWLMYSEPAATHIPVEERKRVRVIDHVEASPPLVRVRTDDDVTLTLLTIAFFHDEEDRQFSPCIMPYYLLPVPVPMACSGCNADGGTVGDNSLCPCCGGTGWLNRTPAMAQNAADYHRLRLKVNLARQASDEYVEADRYGTGNAVEKLEEFHRLLADVYRFAGPKAGQ